jgi:hypothetical protein
MFLRTPDRRNEGISALVMVLVMTVIVFEVTVASLVVTRLTGSNMADEQASLEALELAKSGAEDAIVRVNRYIHCPHATFCPVVYPLTIGSGETCVNIIETITDQEITIYSRGVIQKSEKFVKVILNITPSEALVKVKMFKEIESPGDAFNETGC